ncbi:hypothetical protein A3K29_05045 [Candidatus Collierbacteria bacterium RIFOXYB2_FULL_46_14]|uniref:Uncharacterized protein n=1 Tax=Candidatus Collierbacteria bacterium GW2011_GWA2_46_26 TaxID=1618381 RepID=A0A0G1PJX8_9BACT|nr:MAG: hypothetical protein UX47_C0006G0027 [Candidatus Collierbacteria bacterium GW2011_GWA2_46_26]OGD73463.1 MAG: hypothetical protein A3K29_05045 [Candidatus Collierbacteria bacterium RIFOXYB2_FULL_46_14]OGD76505.1 MAG: hypothetical protein A3K43_05045 [Candidatus Collierbacteria bacterium RIFOXYA2_FULL_46_20]OGD77841.1 MAG: hypothetical protein A3K39_05045 [Candidatus Collierbacteria bacterium RIFOXYC2_FULL_43_15]OGD81132.1 MAG: hypothetical protein A2320_05545 [Pseudomonadales bacterium G
MKLLSTVTVTFDREIAMECGHCDQRFTPEHPDEIKISEGYSQGEMGGYKSLWCDCPKCKRTVDVPDRHRAYVLTFETKLVHVSEKR